MDPANLLPTRRAGSLAAQAARRWRAAALALAVVLILSWGWMANRADTTTAEAGTGAGDAVQAATDGKASAAYQTAQDKAELKLLREALDAGQEVDAHHRHHSQVMWALLQGKISSREAWWQGGDSTCAGWLAANEFETAVAKLKGREVRPPPIPPQGLAFCKQARERK